MQQLSLCANHWKYRNLGEGRNLTKVGKKIWQLSRGCPIHPIRNGSANWCQSVTDRDGPFLCVSLAHGRIVMVVSFRDRLSVRDRLIRGGIMVWGENVGKS